MATMEEIICGCGCGRKKRVRVADIKRGWGKFYSKSCKAKAQERRTGQMSAYLRGDKPKQRHIDREDFDSDKSEYCSSTVRTNKLHCSDCGHKISKGSSAVFEINEGSMLSVFCASCGLDYSYELYLSEMHPFSGEAVQGD